MTLQPAVIFGAMSPVDDMPEETIIKRFMFEGYGRARARFWIREFIDIGWITDNLDGTYKIDVPYRH